MTQTVTILAMHPGMHGLFPDKPDHWEFITHGESAEATIAELGGEVEVLLSASIEKLDKSVLEQLPNLKMVASISAGFSNIDLDACSARGIPVANAPGLNSGDVADLAVAMMSSLLLRMPANQEYILSGQWTDKAPPLRHSLRGKTIGIVGMGSIGQEAAARLEPFAFDIKWWGPRPKDKITYAYVPSLLELAEQSQGLIVCCRPDASTHKMIDKAILEALGAQGALVNVSRGSVVDEVALIDALKSGKLAGAGLDVFDPEPTSPDLWKDVPNVLLTPHQGGSTFETLFKQAQLAQKNVEAFLSGNDLLSQVH
ncbi:MAG: 2-hydroxyacid dehydrogenase [Erythrobacter sp.]|nr:2-hydroxyacid dehydrogenase [Erythrobacter sp.]